jgi:flagellar basal-body rod protein FlgC
MNLFGALDVSASALQAERIRAEVVAANMANSETTRTADGGPYQRQHVIFEAQDGTSFEESLMGQSGFGAVSQGQSLQGGRLRSASFLSAMPGSVTAAGTVPGGVAVTGILRDTSEPLKRYEPGHQSADGDGGPYGCDAVVRDERLCSAGGEEHDRILSGPVEVRIPRKGHAIAERREEAG